MSIFDKYYLPLEIWNLIFNINLRFFVKQVCLANLRLSCKYFKEIIDNLYYKKYKIRIRDDDLHLLQRTNDNRLEPLYKINKMLSPQTILDIINSSKFKLSNLIKISLWKEISHKIKKHKKIKLLWENYNEKLHNGSNFNDFLITPRSVKILNTVREIYFEKNYNLYIPPNLLPPNLKSVIFDHVGNNDFSFFKHTNYNDYNDIKNIQVFEKNTFPKGLKKLKLPYGFNQPIQDVIPDSIEELILPKSFNFMIKCHLLPETLKKITLDKNYKFKNKIVSKTIKIIYNQ